MSTKVIKQYLIEGVLNYANPRHYFLYDGVMEEHNADVYRLVEDLCDENMELQKRIEELEAKLAKAVDELLEIASLGRCDFGKVRATCAELKGENK